MIYPGWQKNIEMASLARISLAIRGFAFFGACSEPSEQASLPDPCTELQALTQRAQNCSEFLALPPLVLPDDPVKSKGICRSILWGILQQGPIASDSSLYSRMATHAQWAKTPLGAEHYATLSSIRFPARIRLSPDRVLEPGVPPTRLRLENQTLRPDLHGNFEYYPPPGSYDLELGYATRSYRYCAQLKECEALDLISHAGQLAPHPRIGRGPCIPSAISR